MSEALPLPPRPNLEQYRRLAKELKQACKSSEPGAIRDWAAGWADSLAHLQTKASSEQIRWYLQGSWDKFKKKQPRVSEFLLADAQFFVARLHGFASWPKFADYLKGAEFVDSPVSQFEAAVDAVVSGDAALLARLLAEHPELVQARSAREHRSTLLHYVSANGVEDFRQRTPANIVEIAKLLLDAGADVNAESEAYGGRSTTLGLAATSCHPEESGVQIPLLEILLERGARLEQRDGSSAVNACLHNGRGAAAAFLAERGARLDVEGAAGVGWLDLLPGLIADATPEQLADSFAWACQFGRTSVVAFLLEQGVGLEARLKHHGQTGLHWAAYGGHPGAVKWLIERGAAVDAKDASYQGTPLEWALYRWGNAARVDDEAFYEVVGLLARAGAKLDPGWFGDDRERRKSAEKVRSDLRMQAALRGEGGG